MANGFCQRCGIIGVWGKHLHRVGDRWLCKDKAACDKALAALKAERRSSS